MIVAPALSIELVPKTSWSINLRLIEAKVWGKVSASIRAAANGRCTCCGTDSKQLEAHEIWSYEESAGQYIQRLVGIAALCRGCHEVKHIGLAGVKGRLEQALWHLARINGWDSATARAYYAQEMGAWRRRSKHDWIVDLAWYDERFDEEGNARR